MSRFFDSKYVFVVVLSLFSFAFTLNMVRGADATANSHFLLAPNVILQAHGPSIPPDPWDGVRIAHGPSIPPDPWEGVNITA